MEKEFMTVGELARRMGVTVRTLQYYDGEGLLSPSAFSEGGRRLYDSRDLIKLHQIISFKYLGFSLEEIRNRIFTLDTPAQVTQALTQQHRAIAQQIACLREAQEAIEALRAEVAEMNTVNFKKYAEIIDFIKMGNQEYWVWKLLDETLSDHVKKRFVDDPEAGERVLETYLTLLDEAAALVERGEGADSPASLEMAAKWWAMIEDFTGGDWSLLPNLMRFGDEKVGWNKDLAVKQEKVDAYVGEILECYFKQNQIENTE